MCALNFDPTQYGVSEAQWNTLSADQQEQFKKMIEDREASKALSGDAIKTENKDKGIAVESTDTKAAARTTSPTSTVPLEDNKALQKQKLEQYKKEYAELYKKNPDLATEDIADVVYTKEKYQIEEGLKNLKKTPDGQVLLADRYLREFAGKEETAQFKESFERYLKEYEDDNKARDAFNGEFFVDDKEKYIRDGKTLTTAQRRMVAHRKALIETLNLDEGKIGKMATSIIKDRYLNSAMNKIAKYDKEISDAYAKGDMKKVEKLKAKAAEDLRDTKIDEVKTKEKDTKEAIELMAEAKLEREIAEERVAKRQIFYSDKDPGYDKENPDHKVLTSKMKKFVDENPGAFKDKDGNFDSKKFKEFFVRVSNENETDVDGFERADYMTSIENRKRGNDEKQMLQRQQALEKQYPDLKDPEKREAFLRDNPKVADELSFINTKAKLKDRRFQGACADICGLDKEKDKLALKRAGHVFTSALKGAGIGGLTGFATGAIGEAFATAKTLNVDYAGILNFAGTVGYQGVKGYKQNYSHNGSVDYNAEYTHNGSVDYNANYSHTGTVDYNANYTHNGSVDYTHNGSVGWNAGGTTPAEWTYEKWENGVLVDSGTIQKDIPWSANGTTDYTASGSVNYKVNGTVSGSADYTANGTVSGSADYTAKGNVSGSVDYTANGTVEGEVAYKGEKDYQGSEAYRGTASGKHSFDWNVPLKAAVYGAIAGGISGAVTGLCTMNKVKYDGGGPRIEARKKVADRERKKLDLKPIEAKPVPLHIPKPDLDLNIKIPPIKAQEFYDYKILQEPGTEVSKAHEIQYKENPSTIVEGRYGVKAGTKEYDAIMGAMLKASGYEAGTNLKVGDKFTLPVVEVADGKVYRPNEDPSKVKKGDLGGTARVARLKEYKVQHFGGGYYIVDNTDPKNPKRLTGLLSKDQAEAQLAKLQTDAEKAGKKPRP